MIFLCDHCGICCKHIEDIPELQMYDSGDGRCIHLLENNLCDIYDERPDICSVPKMYDKIYSDYMSEEEYIEVNLEGCKQLKRQFKM